jgi:hypothetical protein
VERRRAPGVAEQALAVAEDRLDRRRHGDARADRDHHQHEHRLPHDPAQGDPVKARTEDPERAHRRENREPERQPDVHRHPRDQVGAEQQHRALGEVDDAARAVDDHEAERHERVRRSERHALEQELEELGHAAASRSSPR